MTRVTHSSAAQRYAELRFPPEPAHLRRFAASRSRGFLTCSVGELDNEMFASALLCPDVPLTLLTTSPVAVGFYVDKE